MTTLPYDSNGTFPVGPIGPCLNDIIREGAIGGPVHHMGSVQYAMERESRQYVMVHSHSVAGRVAVVTGGAGGIGAAVCRRLAEHGATTIVADIDDEAGRRTAKEIQNSHFIAADITVAADMEGLAATVANRWGTIDILVHAAGISGRPLGDAPVAACPPHVWDRIIQVNLTGAYLASHYIVPHMVKANRGSIVFIGSDDALAIPPPPYDTHGYIAAKGGIMALTKAMAVSYAPQQIRVNAVAPGWVETPMTADLQQDPDAYATLVGRHPLGRFATPDDIAAAVVFLAGDDAGFITGHTLPVEGGATAW